MTKSVKEIEHVMNVGNQNRAVGYVVALLLVIAVTNEFISSLFIHQINFV